MSVSLRSILRSPAVQRGLVAIGGAVLLLLFPSLASRLLYLLVGVAALLLGFVQYGAWRTNRRWTELLYAVVLAGGGLASLIGGETIGRHLSLGVAALIGFRAAQLLLSGYRVFRSDRGETAFWLVAKGVLLLAGSVLLVVAPRSVTLLVLVAIAVAWMFAGAVVIVNAVGETEDSEVPSDLLGAIRAKSMDHDDRRSITETIFEGSDSAQGTVRFVALMSFSTAIAAFGIKADSTAVVIGAMLIAPLMSPIMALSAAILMGWPRRALASARRVGVGIAVGVGGSLLMSLISPEFVSITANSQVLGRVEPTILDLLIALAAGAAGGYAMTHPQVTNSLPGVAIAVALVPPLAVVGVALHSTQWSFALGAFLLFATNLVGIVVASGVTYVLSGYSPWTRVAESDERERKNFLLVGISLALVSVPLLIIGEQILDQSTTRSTANRTVEAWLGPDTEFSVVRTGVSGGEIEVVISGPADPPPPDALAGDLSEALDRDISLTLRVIPQIDFTVEAPVGGDPVFRDP